MKTQISKSKKTESVFYLSEESPTDVVEYIIETEKKE